MGGDVTSKAIQNIVFKSIKPIGKQQMALKAAGQDPSTVDCGSKDVSNAKVSEGRSHTSLLLSSRSFQNHPSHALTRFQKSPSISGRTAHPRELAFSFVKSRTMPSASVLVLFLVAILHHSLSPVVWTMVRFFKHCFLLSTSGLPRLWPGIDISTATSRYFPEATPSALDHFFRPIKKEALRLRAEGPSGGTSSTCHSRFPFCSPLNKSLIP